MQVVDLTPQMLKDFSYDFVHIPCMHFDTKTDIPFDMLPLAVWLMGYEQDSSMYLAFSGWLAGRGECVDPDTTVPIKDVLIEALGPLLANADGSVNHDKTMH